MRPSSATGVVTFVNFTLSALLGPVFGQKLTRVSGGAEAMSLEHYQATFQPMLFGIGAAMILTLFLRETGAAVRPAANPWRIP